MSETGFLNLRKKAFSVLRWLPALLPPVLIWQWMKQYLVNFPFMDDFVWLPFYEKFHHGWSFNLSDLMFVQMEHRLTVPAVLNWIFYSLKPGQITLHNWSSFAQLCLIALNLVFILRRTMPGLRMRWGLVAAGSLVLFSPTQYSTLLWCDCFSSYMAPLFITTAIAVLLSGINVWLRLVICIALAVLSCVSFGSGMLVWPLLVPLIIGTEAISGQRQRWFFLAVWLVAAVVTMKLYFVNLHNQALPIFSYEQEEKAKTFGVHLHEFMKDPWLDLKFILMFGGAMLGRGTFASIHDASLCAGVVLVVVLIAACIPLLAARRDRALRTQTLPWIMIGLYSFAMGGMVAMSRIYARPGLTGALFNRYTIHSIFIVVAALVLGWFCWSRFSAAAPSGWRNYIASAAPVVLGLLIMQVLSGWFYGAQIMESWWSSRLRDATSQLFLKALPERVIQGPLIKTQGLAKRMDDIGLLKPAMPPDNRLDRFVSRPRVIESSAKMETLEWLPSGRMSASGIAYCRGQSRPADGILLCYKDDAGLWRIFAVAQVKQPPLFLREALYADVQFLHMPRPGIKQTSYGQWQIEVDSRDIPKGTHEIGAWVFDFQRQTVSPMTGVYRIDDIRQTVERMDKPEPADKK